MDAIKALFNVAHHNIATIHGTMDYDRITDVIIRLSEVLHDTETDECIWSIGEGLEFCLADLLEGAYWHYTEWHGGQWSKGYAALSALGRIYHPGYSYQEDNDAYYLLNQIAMEETNEDHSSNTMH